MRIFGAHILLLKRRPRSDVNEMDFQVVAVARKMIVETPRLVRVDKAMLDRSYSTFFRNHVTLLVFIRSVCFKN